MRERVPLPETLLRPTLLGSFAWRASGLIIEAGTPGAQTHLEKAVNKQHQTQRQIGHRKEYFKQEGIRFFGQLARAALRFFAGFCLPHPCQKGPLTSCRPLSISEQANEVKRSRNHYIFHRREIYSNGMGDKFAF